MADRVSGYLSGCPDGQRPSLEGVSAASARISVLKTWRFQEPPAAPLKVGERPGAGNPQFIDFVGTIRARPKRPRRPAQDGSRRCEAHGHA